ncbi:hypothetical protein D9758_008745 [Tetrapyrgos nigripes]|uniref:CENP-V/GFA domain-containing protein n=1 Tax=Tetrapyrgos nigripes TaxID=182062 RepID=A0A8H5FX79_9AGAR|nr:hypothetical protein D9758_008745 [Tetrapyrgos nigripes]
MPATHEGSCLCGGIQFTVTGDPFLYILCHCTNCKKASGSAFLANAWFKYEDVEVKDNNLLRTYKDIGTKSGSTLVRQFCSNCGSNVFIRPDKNNLKKGDVYIIHAPLVEGYEAWAPNRESFPEDRCSFLREIMIKPKAKSKL